jgi:hypothetical protein
MATSVPIQQERSISTLVGFLNGFLNVLCGT